MNSRIMLHATAAMALAALLPSTGLAGQPGPHPGYLLALEDLRHARGHLERRRGDNDVKWDEHRAIQEINDALGEIGKSGIDDGKKLPDRPSVDAGADYRGRLHRAVRLLHKAVSDVEQEEDHDFARGLHPRRALDHIKAALHLAEQGMDIARRMEF